MTRKKVVILDDDIDLRELIANTAETLGMETIATASAEQFLSSLSPETSLIVLDLLMPGTDGVEILRALGQQKCNAGIILISGIGARVIETAETMALALGLSVVGRLNKPFSIAQLKDMLDPSAVSQSGKRIEDKTSLRIDSLGLRRAIEREELLLHYQPQIEISTRRYLGVEVLPCWQHPKHGLVYLKDLIEEIETLNLTDELMWSVIHRGLSEIGSVARDRDQQPMTISFNVSVSCLAELAFPDKFVGVANEHGISPEGLILEIGQAGLVQELPHTLDVLARLRMKGVRLSVDDFGTGSMMQQLRQIPANEVKIDGGFVRSMRTDYEKMTVSKIIELCSELDMISVATDVENQQQLDFLHSKGCDIAQGSIFCEPVPSTGLLSWLVAYDATVNPSSSANSN